MSQFKREAVVMIAIPLGVIFLGLLAALFGPLVLRLLN
jgi:hypothetical protein